MLRPDVLADLERYAAAGSFRPDEVARLEHFAVPAKVALGMRIRLHWHTTDCQQVILGVPGLPQLILEPTGEYWIDAEAIGSCPIRLELWSDNDLACGLAGHIEERTLEVVARPVHLSTNRTRIEAPVGAVERLSWVIAGAASAYVRNGDERQPVDLAGTIAVTMPAVSGEIWLCALGDDGQEHRVGWQLCPTLRRGSSFPDFGSLYDSLPELGQLNTG